MSTTSKVNQVDEMLPPGRLAALGLQHVLVLVASAIAVPLIVGGAFRLPKDQIAFLVNAALVAGGVATLIQCVGFWRFGIRLPVIMGVTFAAVGPIVSLAAASATITDIFGSVIIAGALTVLIAPLAGRLARYIPPVVSGTIVAVIGITLLRVGITWVGGGIGARSFGEPVNLGIALLVLAVILVVLKVFDGFVASIAVLVGLIIGVCAAMAAGLVDFAGVGAADWFALVYPFRFGLPTFNLGAIVVLCIVAVVVMVESSGMFLAVGEICQHRVGPAAIARGLAADGLSMIIGGVFNTFPSTSFAQNVGLVGHHRGQESLGRRGGRSDPDCLRAVPEDGRRRCFDSAASARRSRARHVRDGRGDRDQDPRPRRLRREAQLADRRGEHRRRDDPARVADLLRPASEMDGAVDGKRRCARGGRRGAAQRFLQRGVAGKRCRPRRCRLDPNGRIACRSPC